MRKRIAILGSTGSIGRQALEVIAGDKRLSAVALAAGWNWQLLAEQARRFSPAIVAIADASCADQLRKSLPAETRLLAGEQAAEELVTAAQADLVLTAMVGSAGLAPTLAAIRCGADLAIANKEPLVMAGAIIIPAARAAGVRVLPVDSEHSAVFQCLSGHRRSDLRRVIITASGGPFRTWPAEKVYHASLDEVLKHPTWQMGKKVTIDSATLMNKALEVIEAHWLFDLPAEQIEVVIHPESLVHACVEFSDGGMLAQLGPPSMATPIAFALHYPSRSARREASMLDLAAAGTLTFAPADPQRFPAIGLGYQVIKMGGTAGAVLNAANEVAVLAFVAGQIPFGRIVEIVREVLNQAPVESEVSVSAVLSADRWGRQCAQGVIARSTDKSGGLSDSMCSLDARRKEV